MKRTDLERAFAQALEKAGATVVCAVCGYADEQGRSCVILEDDEELQHCESCGNPVDHEGRAVGIPMPNGEVRVVALRLDKGAREALGPKKLPVTTS